MYIVEVLLIGKSPINGPLSIAMFDYRRVTMENGPVEIVDLLRIVIFHRYVNVYQRVGGINGHFRKLN